MQSSGQEKESMREASDFVGVEFKLLRNPARYEGLSYLLSLKTFI